MPSVPRQTGTPPSVPSTASTRTPSSRAPCCAPCYAHAAADPPKRRPWVADFHAPVQADMALSAPRVVHRRGELQVVAPVVPVRRRGRRGRTHGQRASHRYRRDRRHRSDSYRSFFGHALEAGASSSACLSQESGIGAQGRHSASNQAAPRPDRVGAGTQLVFVHGAHVGFRRAACSSALGPPDRADRGDRAQVLDQHPVDGESALA